MDFVSVCRYYSCSSSREVLVSLFEGTVLVSVPKLEV